MQQCLCSWYDVVCGAKSAAKAVAHAASTVVHAVADAAVSAWNDYVVPAWNFVSSVASAVVNTVVDTAEHFYSTAKQVYHAVVNTAVHVVHTVATKLNDVREQAKQLAIRVANNYKVAVNNVVHTATHYAQTAQHVLTTAYHDGVKGVNVVAKYVEHHAATIASIATSVVVFACCEAVVTAVSGGSLSVPGAIGCGALAGAAGGLVEQGFKCHGGGGDACSIGAFGKSALIGGASGALGGALGALGALGGKVVSAVGGKLLGGLLRTGAKDTVAVATEDTATATVEGGASRGAAVMGDSETAGGIEVTHGPNSTSIGDDINTAWNRQNLTNEGEHDVIVHGTRDGMARTADGLLHPNQVADAVAENPNYTGGTCRLLVCHSSSSGFAQDFANRLGVPARAPTVKAGASYKNGRAIVVNEEGEDGYWRLHLPIVARR